MMNRRSRFWALGFKAEIVAWDKLSRIEQLSKRSLAVSCVVFITRDKFREMLGRKVWDCIW
jgi:hypothetical protein